jgi:hypothetical protein
MVGGGQLTSRDERTVGEEMDMCESAYGGSFPVNGSTEKGKAGYLFGLKKKSSGSTSIGAFSCLREEHRLWQKPTAKPTPLFRLAYLFLWKAPRSRNKEPLASHWEEPMLDCF